MIAPAYADEIYDIGYFPIVQPLAKRWHSCWLWAAFDFRSDAAFQHNVHERCRIIAHHGGVAGELWYAG